MISLKTWTGSFFLLLILSGGLQADVTVSSSTDPTAALDAELTLLLGQEHAALGSVSDARLQAIVTPPPRPARIGSKSAPATIGFDEAWLASQPAPAGDAEFECLAHVLYFEARGESLKGQAAVAEVVLNRVDNPSYPKTVCGVVRQSGGGGCQFSWVCDSNPNNVANPEAFDRAGKIARAMLDGAPRMLTEGATHFHTPAVSPAWARRFTLTTRIGSHIFYRQPLRTASN